MLSSLLPLMLLGAACVEPPAAPNGPARITIHLTDAPGDIKAAVVTIDEIYLQGTGGRTVLRSTPYTVDLVSLATTSTLLLDNVEVQSGTYPELRFVVSGAYVAVEQSSGDTRIFASSPNYVGLPPGTVVDGQLQLPSFATSGLKVQLPDGGLKVPTSGEVSLQVDFNVAESFGHQAGTSGMWVMHPVITATDITQGTTLTVTLGLGTGVTLPVGVTLGDFQATLAASNAPSKILLTVPFSLNGSGGYRAALGFVAPGAYVVNLVVPAAAGSVTVSPAVPLEFTAAAGPGTTLALTVTGTTSSEFVLTAVTASTNYTCGLAPGGTAFCWGSNIAGTLGDGTTNSRAIPGVVVVPAGLVFESVIAASVHACGLTAAGAAYCWGDNTFGELGDGTNSAHLTPASVSMPAGVTFVLLTGGSFFTCSLTPGGEAYCWGNNDAGQLGDGTTTSRPTPAAVTMPTGITFTSVTAHQSQRHACGVTPAGVAYCWGDNGFGQLGDGSTTIRPIPTSVAMPAGVSFVSITAGRNHTCGLSPQGAGYCWGDNTFGELGDGTRTSRPVPTAVAMPAGVSFASITAGGVYTCGLTTMGAAYCWGNNALGQIGDGTTLNRVAPTAVAMPVGVSFASMTAGFQHTCGLTPAGVAYCWGNNGAGALGDGTSVNRLTPTPLVHP